MKAIAKGKAMARIRELTGEAIPDNALLDIQVPALTPFARLHWPHHLGPLLT